MGVQAEGHCRHAKFLAQLEYQFSQANATKQKVEQPLKMTNVSKVNVMQPATIQRQLLHLAVYKKMHVIFSFIYFFFYEKSWI